MTTFKLSDLFDSVDFKWDYLFDSNSLNTDLNTEITICFSQQTALYFNPNPTTSSSVCYAESAELRADFKTFMTAQDIKQFVLAQLLQFSQHTEISYILWANSSIFYPHSTDQFRAMCNFGSLILDSNLIKFPSILAQAAPLHLYKTDELQRVHNAITNYLKTLQSEK